MGSVVERELRSAHSAMKAFRSAMDHWDEAGADAAVATLARNASADELFEVFAEYGSRDLRDIGHKAIYVANSFRTLESIGWQPVSQWACRIPDVQCETAILAVPGVLSDRNFETKKHSIE
jgi:hypothetical protein